jgi:hypothetical protein
MYRAIKCKIFEREKERLKCGVSCAQDLFVRETLHLSEVEAAVEGVEAAVKVSRLLSR